MCICLFPPIPPFYQNINALSLDAYRRLTFQLYGSAGEAWLGIFLKRRARILSFNNRIFDYLCNNRN